MTDLHEGGGDELGWLIYAKNAVQTFGIFSILFSEGARGGGLVCPLASNKCVSDYLSYLL